jgi:uncharacterized membrane protein YbaN (DUF454 family)
LWRKNSKFGSKPTHKTIVKKMASVVESSFILTMKFCFHHEKKTFYTMLEATPKNEYWLVCFMKAKREVPNSNVSFSNLFTLFQVIFFLLCRLLELFKIVRYVPIICLLETWIHRNIDPWKHIIIETYY